MIFTFEDYSKEQLTLTFEQMKEIHTEMVAEIGSDADALELYRDFVDAATKYAAIRAIWNQISREQKMEIDAPRTVLHDSTIDCLNILARYLKNLGKEAKWRDLLGYTEENPSVRKTIGDFACFVVFVNSINAR